MDAPRSFSDIKGQQEALNIISQYLRNSRVPSGMLFYGPEGVGKKTSAILMAKALNCLSFKEEPCGVCPSCQKIDKRQHPDVHLIENAHETVKAEDIRFLRQEICLKPYEGRKRVFIIDNAHKLTLEAGNSILKILEETPGESVIILVTSSPSRLLKTIVSRCQSLRFRSLPRQDIQQILSREYSLDEQSACLVSGFSAGSLGAALGMKDSRIITDRNRAIDYFFGGADETAAAWKEREDVKTAMNAIAVWLRDMLMVKINMPESQVFNSDRNGELADYASRYSLQEICKAFGALSESLLYLEQNVNSRLLVSGLRMEFCKDDSGEIKKSRPYFQL